MIELWFQTQLHPCVASIPRPLPCRAHRTPNWGKKLDGLQKSMFDSCILDLQCVVIAIIDKRRGKFHQDYATAR